MIMRMYPAIKAQMGKWHYYIVCMKMSEIAKEVNLAHKIHEEHTLSEAIQRPFKEKRVKKEIVGYLVEQPERFFSSIVVAAIDGKPEWQPAKINEDILPRAFVNASALRDSFGMLFFGETPKYYALDGQHRVAAIKCLLDGSADREPPSGFADDLLSVIVVVREDHELSEDDWLRRYRRLFSSLNRYARPTDKDTNIIMDEDDVFAILTRYLISRHKFFKAIGPERESFVVQTQGKALKKNVQHFTTLQTLYSMTETLLTTKKRRDLGWNGDARKINKQIRPDDNNIDIMYRQISTCWDAILESIPDLQQEPVQMRQHDIDPNRPAYRDHLLFWPIGQELLAKAVRALLDDRFPDQGFADTKEMVVVLQVLARVPWELHRAPWRHLLLVRDEAKKTWRIRSEDRKKAIDCADKILRWMLTLDPDDDDHNYDKNLRHEWRSLLYVGADEDDNGFDAMWTQTKVVRSEILALRKP